MSLYGLAADLFSDIDKARAAGPSIHSRDLSRGGGQSSALSKWKQMRPQPGQEGELPRLRSGGRQAEHDKRTPTLELLEGCLRDVQQVRRVTMVGDLAISYRSLRIRHTVAISLVSKCVALLCLDESQQVRVL